MVRLPTRFGAQFGRLAPRLFEGRAGRSRYRSPLDCADGHAVGKEMRSGGGAFTDGPTAQARILEGRGQVGLVERADTDGRPAAAAAQASLAQGRKVPGDRGKELPVVVVPPMPPGSAKSRTNSLWTCLTIRRFHKVAG